MASEQKPPRMVAVSDRNVTSLLPSHAWGGGGGGGGPSQDGCITDNEGDVERV